MKYIGNVFYDRRRDFLDLRNEYLLKQGLTPDIVMIGDSITEGFNLNFAGITQKQIINSGISGDLLSNLHQRIKQDAIDFQPQQIFVLIGINDLLTFHTKYDKQYKQNMDELFTMYKKNIQTILDAAIEPVIFAVIKVSKYEYNFMWINEQIKYFNQLLKEFAKSNKLKYVDFNQVLADNYGSINDTYFSDGLHPNEKGYFEMYKLLHMEQLI